MLGKVKVEVRLILGLAISPPHYLHDPRPTLVIVPDDVNGVDIPYLGGHTIVGGHDFGEIVIHQAIETIEFVLGTSVFNHYLITI